MKDGIGRPWVVVFFLYIPHGSDESISAMTRLLKREDFISHMVQMKVTCSFPTPSRDQDFISHMVQMKGNRIVKVIRLGNNFISHMVQMKDKYCFEL